MRKETMVSEQISNSNLDKIMHEKNKEIQKLQEKLQEFEAIENNSLEESKLIMLIT